MTRAVVSPMPARSLRRPVRALAGESTDFTDVPLIGKDPKEVAEALKGKWVAEISELVGLRKGAIEDVKALLSRTSDRARFAYARFAQENLRRCVFIGTTNSKEYLSDETGNRRFLPVRLRKGTKLDRDGLLAARDQIFAEAVECEGSYGDLTLPANLWGTAAEAAEARRTIDPWVDILRSALSTSTYVTKLPDGGQRIANSDLRHLLSLQARECNSHVARRISTVMGELGWSGLQWRNSAIRERGYWRAS